MGHDPLSFILHDANGVSRSARSVGTAWRVVVPPHSHIFLPRREADRDKMQAALRVSWGGQSDGLIGSWEQRVADMALFEARVTRPSFSFLLLFLFHFIEHKEAVRRVLLRV
jgi:hypothetical protein